MTSAVAANGPHVLRQMNGVAVLGALRARSGEACRISDLVAATGLSRPAITRALVDLAGAGLVEDIVVEAGEEDGPQLGRPARLSRFRAEAGHVCGVDVGPHKILVIVADLAGRAVASHRSVVSAGASGPDLIVIVREAVTAALDAAGLTVADLWAVCVGTPGIVDRENGIVVKAPSVQGWAGLPIVPELRGWLDCPVIVDNDASLAVVAEQAAGTGGDDLVYVHWGQRIGAGIVIGGRLYRGATAAAGELGFIDVVSPAPSGGHVAEVADGMGAFERLVGASAIHRLALDAYAAAGRDRPAGMVDGQDGLPGLFEAASAGDQIALDVVEQVAALFARGLGVFLLLIDPGQVVIGGGLSIAGEVLLGPVRRHLERRVLSPVEVVASQLGEQAVALGAVRAALERVESELTAPARLTAARTAG